MRVHSPIICAINGNMMKASRLSLSIVLLAILLAGCSPQPELPRVAPDATILAFGDSLTYGSGAKKDEAYPAVLSRLTGFEVINGGIPGEVTTAGLARLPGILDEIQPQLMILCHGGNDMLRQQDLNVAADNLRSMIRLAQQQGISVILLAVPRPGIFLTPPGFYEQVAEEMGVPIESEVLPDILSTRSLKSDRIHPNRDGYRVMAEAVIQLMKETGAIR